MLDERIQNSGLEGPDPLEEMVGEVVVLDTDTPILYIGKLVSLSGQSFVLEEADMHDCRDGHANKELYLSEAHEHGIAINRRRIVVMRSSVISLSLLADIVAE
jgi:hypothetical protein